jgi:hypothetical protein
MVPFLLQVSGNAQEEKKQEKVAQSKTVGPVQSSLGSLVEPAVVADSCTTCCGQRRLFESDRAFEGFIGPISNPVFSKDPRSLTEARALFIHNQIPGGHPLGGGNFQVFGLQVRVALTERLTLIADKDGYATINPGGAPNQDGWLNLGLGMKYVFIRDVERQLLLSGGFMWEPQTGEAGAFSSHGDGTFAFFLTGGKEFAGCWHALGTIGYQLPIDASENSSYYYVSLHLDRKIGRFYPLVELNWFHWVAGGNRGLPAALGEGDGLLNLGTTGVAGNDLVTAAVGGKFKFGPHAEIGAAWEFPISNRRDLIDSRLLAEFILRY